MGNLPPSVRVTQVRALQALLRSRRVKVSEKEAINVWDNVVDCAPWMALDKIWDPESWERVIHLTHRKEV